MKKAFAFILALTALFTLYGCFDEEEKTCVHDYYLADYFAPTNITNGSKTFTCSKCGYSYKVAVPHTESDDGKSDDTEPKETEEDLTRKRSVKLFDYPMYSNKNVITGVTDKLKYCAEETDVDGWKHTDCYIVCGSTSEAWVRYEINGKYSTLSGTLYDANNSGGSGWLEFYDGDEFIAATKRVGDATTSTEFEIDITGVEYLTVHFCATDTGTWMIADDIVMTK